MVSTSDSSSERWVNAIGNDQCTDRAATREKLLARALTAAAAGAISVRSMSLAPGGNSRETWIADVAIGDEERRVVFRCDPDGWIRPVEMEREIRGLRLAAQAGVPVPRVLISSAEFEIGRPYVITEFIAGVTIPRRVIRDPEHAAARQNFATECGEILARLHDSQALAADWDSYDPIEELEAYLAEGAFPSPVLRGATCWLQDNRPPRVHRLSPVHRDFRLGNLMINEQGIAAVLDWETCRLSEPEEDLAWLCSRSWRYGSDQPVGGLGSLDELFAAYEHASGRSIEIERFNRWSVFSGTRWGTASTVRPRPGSPGDAMEQAAIIRRGCIQELNVLRELERYVQR
jgi:aminoglycoside phosphotransferase (APT) family kinase protein